MQSIREAQPSAERRTLAASLVAVAGWMKRHHVPAKDSQGYVVLLHKLRIAVEDLVPGQITLAPGTKGVKLPMDMTPAEVGAWMTRHATDIIVAASGTSAEWDGETVMTPEAMRAFLRLKDAAASARGEPVSGVRDFTKGHAALPGEEARACLKCGKPASVKFIEASQGDGYFRAAHLQVDNGRGQFVTKEACYWRRDA